MTFIKATLIATTFVPFATASFALDQVFPQTENTVPSPVVFAASPVQLLGASGVALMNDVTPQVIQAVLTFELDGLANDGLRDAILQLSLPTN